MAVLRVDAYKSLAFSSITASFVAVGSAVSENWRAFRVLNTCDTDMIISLDGTANNLYLPANSFVLWDISANADPENVNDNLLIGINTQFYAKYVSAPSSGAVIVEGIYARSYQG